MTFGSRPGPLTPLLPASLPAWAPWFRPGPLCLPQPRLAEEGIPTILRLKASLRSWSSSHLPTHTCAYGPRFQACAHANSPTSPFPGLVARKAKAGGSGSLLCVAWGSAPLPEQPPARALCPLVSRLEEASSNVFSLPVHSLPVPSPAQGPPARPISCDYSEVAGLGSLCPLLADLRHRTDELSLNITSILSLPCS